MRALVMGAILLAGSLVALTASAQPACESEQAEAGVPVRLPHTAADFGVLPPACPATALSLRGRLDITIDEPAFYGQLLTGGALGGRVEIVDEIWLSLQVPGPEYRFVANATVEADGVHASGTTLGAHKAIAIGDHVSIAPYGRVLLPTESVFENARRFGLEQGIAATFSVHRMLEIIAGYSSPFLFTVLGERTRSQWLPMGSADVAFRPFSWGVLVAGLGVRVGTEEERFESLDPRLSLRFYPWRGMLVDMAGAFPSLGRDRADGRAALTLGWAFDR